MKTSIQVNTDQDQLSDNVFNYQDFNDNLSRIMQKYNALYIEKQHNIFATKLMNGESNKTMEALTDAKINKVQKMLCKLNKLVNQFSF